MSSGNPDNEWEPQLPWELFIERLTATKRARFITYNVLLFFLLGTAFATTALAQYGIGGSTDSTAPAATLASSLGELVTSAVFQAILFAPVVALIAGSLAGITFDEPSRSVAVTGGVGALIGYLPLLGLFFVVSWLAGAEIGLPIITDEISIQPIATSFGVVLAGGGSGYITRRFLQSALEHDRE